MKCAVRILPEADRDLTGIADDLAERASLEVAEDFLAVTMATFVTVAGQPEMGWRCRLPHRDLQGVRVFRIEAPFEKYLMFYRSLPGRIEILRVLYGARDLAEIWSL